MNNICDC